MKVEQEYVSEGKCIYCGEMHAQNSIARHLAKHLSKMEKEKRDPSKTVFHLNIQADIMFLHVLVKGSASFKTLDTFLRNIWVECCNHLSDFHHKTFDIRMSDKFDNILYPKLKFQYSYDYGSTTSFTLQVAGSYRMAQKENVVLLSRNEPLKIKCSLCKTKLATLLCTEHWYQSDECFFCNDCATKHEEECEDFADFASMPVVNSPRMGICGYEGGRIDKERDAVY